MKGCIVKSEEKTIKPHNLFPDQLIDLLQARLHWFQLQAGPDRRRITDGPEPTSVLRHHPIICG